MSDDARLQERAPAEDRPESGLTTAALAGAGARQAAPAQPDQGQAGAAPALFPEGESGELKARWDAIQASFVDEPRRAVEHADSLVATAMQRLAEIFAEERSGLEAQWDRGDNVSTEDLRVALQRYRSFFTRLLSM